MTRIIVPIDFSKESLHGLDLAIILAEKYSAHIQLVYVQKKSSDYHPGSKEGEYKYAVRQFDHIIYEYTPKLPKGLKISYIIKTGKIYKEVVNQAESFEKSFIISSTHGASGFEQLFIGSNSFKIISATFRPVISIRGSEVPESFNEIVLPIDITTDTRQKVSITAEIAKKFDARVHVIGVTSSNSKDIHNKILSYTNQVCDLLKNQEINYVTNFIVGNNITDITLEYAEENNANLISIMTEQSVSFTNFVIGSYAQQMLNKSNIPVLSITPKELRISGEFSTNAG
ncbi:MAG: universal stress protein [Bacteroidales bacterium]|jgi:nucleotide-binding universal stress UspA family protein|nr:universal stress protein [Bacteroidales bacterium]